jgi:hypothetical protein
MGNVGSQRLWRCAWHDISTNFSGFWMNFKLGTISGQPRMRQSGDSQDSQARPMKMRRSSGRTGRWASEALGLTLTTIGEAFGLDNYSSVNSAFPETEDRKRQNSEEESREIEQALKGQAD